MLELALIYPIDLTFDPSLNIIHCRNLNDWQLNGCSEIGKYYKIQMVLP